MRVGRLAVHSDGCLDGVSVVVPCYNYGRYLDECLSSILVDNANVDTEVILIDDASTDGSAEIARRLAQEFSRIRLVLHRRNAGHIATYNEGLSLATKKFVSLVSADDMLTPGSLGRAIALLEASPKLGMVYGRAVNFQGASPPSSARIRVRSTAIWHGEDWIAAICRRGINPISSPEVVVRTAIQKQVGGYDTRHPHAGDLHMWLRIAAIAKLGHLNGHDQAYRRVHTSSMTIQYADPLVDLIERRAVFADFFDSWYSSARSSKLRSLAFHALAKEAIELCIRRITLGDDDLDSTSLKAFAIETSPMVTDSVLWRELDLVEGGGGSAIRKYAFRIGREIRWRWAWHRWNTFGV